MKNKVCYLNHMALMDSLKKYASPKSKITTLVKSGELIRIKRNLYLAGQESNYSIMTLGNIIFGPSYISFETALSYYNLIPENVYSIMSATYKKNKNKIFKTPVGNFIYKYVNPDIYPYGIKRIVENGNVFLIAGKEKALCDTLSKIRGIQSLEQLEALLRYDLRFDKHSLKSMNIEYIMRITHSYKKKFYNYLINI